MHIAQISLDTSLLEGLVTEAFRRQVAFARRLETRFPGSQTTIIVLASSADQKIPIETGNLSIVPLTGAARGRLRLYGMLKSIHATRRIDVITCQQCHDEAWIALTFSKFNRVPVVGQLHFDPFNRHARQAEFRGISGRLRYLLFLRTLRRFPSIRVVGRRIEKCLKAEGVRALVAVVPVQMSMLSNRVVGDYCRSPELLFVGRLVDAKNLFGWLRIASGVSRLCPDVRFTIAGDGPLREDLERAAGLLGLSGQIQFTGAVPYDDLPKIYIRASVFLLTSHYEGFGRVVAEAGAYRCPVVGPCIAGVEDIVLDGETGFLVHAGDEQAFIDRVVELFRKPDLARRMGEAAAERVRRLYSPEKLTDDWIDVLSNARICPKQVHS